MANINIDSALVTAIEKYAYPLGGALSEYDPIIKAAKHKQFVLIGEASHGTQEFYRSRAQITQRLICEEGFDAVAVEADWPDAYRVNRYIRGHGEDASAATALNDFERFPTWMWRNTEVLYFIKWLFSFNNELDEKVMQNNSQVGFYGLDLYSLSASIHSVVAYLDKIDPSAARRARIRYGCLDHFMNNPQAYGYAAEFGLAQDCEQQIIDQLVELRQKSSDYIKLNGLIAEDDYFCAIQNAKLVKNAQEYYRSMFRGRSSSWNLRDQHMFETLEDITAHLSTQLNRDAKIVVWAHNSHLGNASATDMSKRGEFNIGQLVREAHGDKALLVGFSSCRGTVTAASDWDAPEQRKRVREPWPDSYEEVFHHVNHKQFLLDLSEDNKMVDLLMEPRLQRAIGVIYRPDTERHSHYYYACLPEQFDFILHYDNTNALEPLETSTHWHRGEMDETYPTGL